jgi:hypothetical protein
MKTIYEALKSWVSKKVSELGRLQISPSPRNSRDKRSRRVNVDILRN